MRGVGSILRAPSTVKLDKSNVLLVKKVNTDGIRAQPFNVNQSQVILQFPRQVYAPPQSCLDHSRLLNSESRKKF